MGTYVRNIYTLTCVYIPVWIIYFSLVRGAREKAGTVGDEVEAVAAAKVVTYVRTYIFIY